MIQKLSSKFRKVPRCETSRKETFKVGEVREFEYGGSHEILMKKTMSSLESPLVFTLTKSGATATLPSKPLYGSKLPINPNKLKDITNLANKYLPTQYRNFYNTLTASNASED